MAEVPKAKPPEGGKGKGLNAKIGGIPVWVIALGVVAAIGVGLYIRNKSATAATTAAATPASGTDTTGGAGSAAASPPDLTPVEDLAQSINGLTGILGAGAGIPAGNGSLGASVGTQTTQPATQTTTQPSPAATPVGTNATSPAELKNIANQKANAAVAQYAGAPAIIPNQNAFGGIVSDVKNKAGTTVITYASGRVVEQAPGKTAYVAKKGKT